MHLRPNLGPSPFSHGKALQKERQILLIALYTSVTIELAQAFFPLFLFNLGITHECLCCDSCCRCGLHSDINTSKKLESIFTSHLHRGKCNVPHGGFSAPHHVYTFFFFLFLFGKTTTQQRMWKWFCKRKPTKKAVPSTSLLQL